MRARTMPPLARKIALTVHVVSSVGWLGAVAAFLALAIAGLESADAQLVRSVYVSMDLVTWWVIVPLSFASLITGVIQALGTTWGVVRHYWVLIKLLLTIVATGLLLLHTQPIGIMARAAMETTLSSTDMRELRLQLIFDAAAALVVLLVNTTLSVLKPRGVTPYGQRKGRETTTAVAGGAR